MHPLTDLTNLSIEELELRIGDLSRKYFLTQNPQLQSQISLLIDESKEEIRLKTARRRLEEERQKENPDSDNNDPESELDNLINVS